MVSQEHNGMCTVALFPGTHWLQHRNINPKSTYPCTTPTKSINGQVLIDYHFQQTLPFFGCGCKSFSIPIYKMHRHLVCRAVRQVCENQRSPPFPVHPLLRPFGWALETWHLEGNVHTLSRRITPRMSEKIQIISSWRQANLNWPKVFPT